MIYNLFNCRICIINRTYIINYIFNEINISLLFHLENKLSARL